MKTRSLRRYKTRNLIQKRLEDVKNYQLLDTEFIQERLNYLSKNRPISCPVGRSKCYFCGEPHPPRQKNTRLILENEGYYEYRENEGNYPLSA